MSPSDARTPESLVLFQGSRDVAFFNWNAQLTAKVKRDSACSVIHRREGLQPNYLTNLSYTAYNEITL